MRSSSWRRPRSKKKHRKFAGNKWELQRAASSSDIGLPQHSLLSGRRIAVCCLLIGGMLLYLAGRDYLFYAPIRQAAISFLQGLVDKEFQKSGLPGRNDIEVKIHDIHITGDRAIVNVGLATPGNWVDAQLYAARQENRHWKILGVTAIDPHVENRLDIELSKEIKTAFRSSPGIQTKRY